MDTPGLRAAVATERRAVADMLDSLSDQQWASQSLCEGWTVREVAAHLNLPFLHSMPSVFVKLIAAKGNFNTVADKLARADATMSTRDLAENIRKNADHKFTPPGAGYEAPLTDNVLHGLDIRVPLGLGRKIPEATVRAVLDTLTTPRTAKFFKTSYAGVTLQATDLDWTSGSGPCVSGTGDDFMLLFGARPGAIERLSGEGVAVLQNR